MRTWRAANPERNRRNWTAYQKKNRARINTLRRHRRRVFGYTENHLEGKRRHYQRYKEGEKAKVRARYRRIKADPVAYRALLARVRSGLRKWRAEHREHYNEQARSYARRDRKKKPEHFRRKANEYYRRKKRDPVRYVKFLAACRKWAKLNPEKRKRAVKQWKLTHPIHARELRRRGVSRRRARKKGARGIHTHQQWMARVAVHGWRCFYCRIKLTPKTLTQDHRIPLSKGGTDFASNLVPACGSCNSRKGNAHRNRRSLNLAL
jgi:5-methylcytosine-specific restriction endonuclease McrA